MGGESAAWEPHEVEDVTVHPIRSLEVWDEVAEERPGRAWLQEGVGRSRVAGEPVARGFHSGPDTPVAQKLNDVRI